MRPYELEPGASDRAFDEALDILIAGLETKSHAKLERAFARSIERMKQVPYDRTHRKPQVLIVGEYLLNFHPGANHDVERYLERNGMEVIEARMTDVIRKTYFYQHAQEKEYHVSRPFTEKAWHAVADSVFDVAHDTCDAIASAHPLYEPPCRMPDLVRASDPIIHHTFDAGEGVLIPGEILHHAAHGCTSFLILQPFGCLPNHVVGRGIAKRLKEMYPNANILPLDYDPDVSFANIENRLQMLILSARGAENSGADKVAQAVCDGEGGEREGKPASARTEAAEAISSAVASAAQAASKAATEAAYTVAGATACTLDAAYFASDAATAAADELGRASGNAAARAQDAREKAHIAAAHAQDAAAKLKVAAKNAGKRESSADASAGTGRETGTSAGAAKPDSDGTPAATSALDATTRAIGGCASEPNGKER